MLLGPEAFPACLNDGTEFSDTVIVSGWGQTSTTRRIMSDVLQKVVLYIIFTGLNSVRT